MDKNSLLLAILIILAGTGSAYWLKAKHVTTDGSSKGWGSWSNPQKEPEVEEEPESEESEPEDNSKPKSYEEALKIAADTKKKIVLYFGAEWCGPCQTMHKETLSDADVIAKLEDFVFYEVDTDKEPDIAKKFRISGVPSYKIVDSNESVVKEGSGFKSAKNFIDWLSAASSSPHSGRNRRRM